MPLLLLRSGGGLLLCADIAYAVLAAPHGDPPHMRFVALAPEQGPMRDPAVWGVFQLFDIVPQG